MSNKHLHINTVEIVCMIFNMQTISCFLESDITVSQDT